MPEVYKILTTPYCKNSLLRLDDFLARKYSKQHALNNRSMLQEKIQSVLSTQPRIAPVSSRLIELGISDYRQWAIDDHNIVFYKINDKDAVVHLLLVMDSRQSIQKLLFELLLLN